MLSNISWSISNLKNIQLRDYIQRIEDVQPRDDVQKDTEPNAVAEPTAVENDTSQNIDSISPILENDGAGDPSPGNAQLGVIPFDNNPKNSPAGAIKRKKKSIPGPWTIAGVLSGTASGFVIGGPFVIVVAGFGYYGGQIRDKTGKSVYENMYEEYENLTWAEKKEFLKRLGKFSVDVVVV